MKHYIWRGKFFKIHLKTTIFIDYSGKVPTSARTELLPFHDHVLVSTIGLILNFLNAIK